jgi:hypothetical protein
MCEAPYLSVAGYFAGFWLSLTPMDEAQTPLSQTRILPQGGESERIGTRAFPSLINQRGDQRNVLYGGTIRRLNPVFCQAQELRVLDWQPQEQ